MEKPADIGGQLLGLRSEEEHAIVEGMEKFIIADPFFPIYQFLVHDSDLTGRAAKTDPAEFQPEEKGLLEGRPDQFRFYVF